MKMNKMEFSARKFAGRRNRSRLAGILSGAVMFALVVFSGTVNAQTPDYTLYIERGILTVHGAGGADLDVWGYTTLGGSAPMIPGPILESTEGQTLTVRVVNNHTKSHNFVIQGVTSDTTAISPGGSRTYTFTTSNAGVYFYRDTLSNNVNRAMGMHGALIVRASGGVKRAWSGGPSYNQDRLWVVTDMDKPRWNDVAAAGGNVNTSVYRPNYFLMNGQGGHDGMLDRHRVWKAMWAKLFSCAWLTPDSSINPSTFTAITCGSSVATECALTSRNGTTP